MAANGYAVRLSLGPSFAAPFRVGVRQMIHGQHEALTLRAYLPGVAAWKVAKNTMVGDVGVFPARAEHIPTRNFFGRNTKCRTSGSTQR
jgi:hypothetical protein